MAKKMRTINNPLDRQTRNDINYNFETLENDLSDGLGSINEKLDDVLDGRQLEELFDAAADARQEAESARNQSAYANEKGNYANEKGNYASEQGDYAKVWGDYAKEKGEYAAEKTAEIEQAHTDLSQIKVEAVNATQSANTQAEYAKEQAEYAKAVSEDVDGKMVDIDNAISLAIQKGQESEQQGLIAKEQGDYAQSVIDSYKHVGDWQGSVEYKKNQEVLYNGSTYRAIEDNEGTQPTDKSKWQLIAQRGIDGEGAVSSVNGVMPDMDGNVNLGDIADKQYVDDKIGDVDFSALETKEDATAKLEEAKSYTDTKTTNMETTTGAQSKVDEHASNTDNPHKVTKSQVGLSNVDNVKQANKEEHDRLAQSVATHLADDATDAHNIANIAGLQNALNNKQDNLPEDRRRKITFGIGEPTGGSDGDIYFQYE